MKKNYADPEPKSDAVTGPPGSAKIPQALMRKRYIVNIDGNQLVHDRLQRVWNEVDVRDRDWVMDQISTALVGANPATRIEVSVQ